MSLAHTDIAPPQPLTLPDTGIGRGWEPTVVMIATLLLLAFGLVNLYSASAALSLRQGLPDHFYALRQAGGAAVGLALLVACVRVPYTWWRFLAWPAVFLCWVALIILVLPGTTSIAPEINGARRWLNIGVTLQPSEFTKVALLIWTAHVAVKKQDQFRSLSRGLLPFLLVWSALLVPILLQPDLSTAFLLGLLGTLIVFAAGGRVAHFAFLGVLMLPLAWLQLGTGFRRDRLLAFRDAEAHVSGAGYQVHQSLVAIGSGGTTGVGFGEGRQKFGFLPEPHNDFIFAMIGEEWGLFGVAFLIGLYLTLIVVGFRIAQRAQDLFGQLLAIGISNFIALHAVLHMSVGLGLVPATGLSLPLVSYGRSNLLVTLIAIGILISIAKGDPRARAIHV